MNTKISRKQTRDPSNQSRTSPHQPHHTASARLQRVNVARLDEDAVLRHVQELSRAEADLEQIQVRTSTGHWRRHCKEFRELCLVGHGGALRC